MPIVFFEPTNIALLEENNLYLFFFPEMGVFNVKFLGVK